MASQTFEAALNEPDNDASHWRLQQLVVGNEFQAVAPRTAEKYLHAFCEAKFSYIRRRWSGLALAGMIRTSPVVATHLRPLHEALYKLGAIILSDTEREETKVVAGLAMRQALEQGMEYNSFWSSDKVRNSAPSFPQDLGARWMVNFQDFLDALYSLALTKSNNDTSIMYPVSLAILNDFKWAKSNEGLLVAIIQAGLLTVIIPDRELCKIRFLDIPIDHIRSARSQRSTLHDSQARTNEHEPWDLTLMLKATPWSYRLNSTSRTGTEVVFVFQHSADAKEWESCISEHQQSAGTSIGSSPKVGRHIPSSSLIKHRNTQKDHTNSTMPKHTTQIAGVTKETLKRHGPQATSHLPTLQDSGLSLPPDQDDALHLESALKSPVLTSRGLIQIGAHGQATSENKQSEMSSQIRPLVPSNENHNTAKITKSALRSKGKLPRVSQSTKDKAFKRIHDPAEDFDMALTESENTETIHKHIGPTQGRTKAKVQHSPKEPAHAGKGRIVNARVARSRAKRKVDDDGDEFVPDAVLLKKNVPSNRKSSRCTETRHQMQRKRAHMENFQAAKVTSDNTEATIKEEVRNVSQTPVQIVIRAPRSQQIQFNTCEVSSSIEPIRFALIKRPIDSQRRVALSGTFKKSQRPAQPSPQPSTPTKSGVRLAEPPLMPQNPVDIRGDQPVNFTASSSSSSPPPPPPTLRNVAKDANGWTPRIGIDAEILSSNSKPIPASPNAESTAISGHANRKDVDMEKKKVDVQIAKNDPFRQGRINQKVTSFTRRLTGEGFAGDTYEMREHCSMDSPEIRKSLPQAMKPELEDKNRPILDRELSQQQHTPNINPMWHAYPKSYDQGKAPVQSCQERYTTVSRNAESLTREVASPYHDGNCGIPFGDLRSGLDLEGDETLVDYSLQSDFAPEPATSSIYFPSSPPIEHTPSNHSSTSAESDHPLTNALLSTSEAKEMEWEASLNPHQRALHDVLIRTSKRVLRNIVDNETAVTDIAEIFERDGEHVISSLLQRHEREYKSVFNDMNVQGKSLQSELKAVSKELAKQRGHVRAMV